MDREKPVRKSTDVIPITPGSSLMNRRGQSWLERDFDSIFDDFRKSFDVLMRPYFPLEMQMLGRTGALSPRYTPLDVIDEGDHYLVHIELPGFSKENVEVQINSDGMSVHAKKEMEKEEKNYLHRERVYSMNARFPSPKRSILKMPKGR